MADNQSRYCYPGTDVLINKADLRTQVQLDRFEARVATQRLAELQLRPITGRFDLKHWQAIHRHIFGDVYPFAGKRISSLRCGIPPWPSAPWLAWPQPSSLLAPPGMLGGERTQKTVRLVIVTALITCYT